MTITSKEVAEMLGKRHDNLLRAIRKYIKQLGDEAPKYFSEDPDKGGRLYHITKAGCDLMAGRIMINWLTKLRKQLLEANGGHTEADLQRELSRKSKLLDAYLDGILSKEEYQRKAEELDERIIQLKAETEKNKANSGDIAEIDKVLDNIDEEVARYVDGNEKLKVEYLLEHLEQVQIFPDKVIVIVPILSEGIVVEKTQYVSREKRRRKVHNHFNYVWADKKGQRKNSNLRQRY